MKKTLIFVVLLSFVSVFVSGCNLEEDKQVNANQTLITEEKEEIIKDYNEVAKEFNEVNSKDLKLLEQEKESFFVYTGRASCPFCQRFAPKLYESNLLNENDDVVINYLNSDNESDTGLYDYLSKYNIEYVPNFSYFKDGILTETLQISSDITINQISDFLTSK